MLRGLELVAHDFVLETDFGERLWLQHEEAGHYCYHQGDDDRQSENHSFYNL